MGQNKVLANALHVIKLAREDLRKATLYLNHLKLVGGIANLNDSEAEEEGRYGLLHAGVAATSAHHNSVVVHNLGALNVEAVNVVNWGLGVDVWGSVLVGLGLGGSIHLKGPGHGVSLSLLGELAIEVFQILDSASKVKGAVEQESEHGTVFPVAGDIAGNVVALGQLGENGPGI